MKEIPAGLNPILAGLYTQNHLYCPAGHAHALFPAAVSPDEAHTLYRLACAVGPATTLEIGLGIGFSALAILQAHAERGAGRHITMDPFQGSRCCGLGVENIRRAGFGQFHQAYGESSHITLPLLCGMRTRAKLAFIDGNHRFEFVFLDFFYADLLLEDNGYLVLHDALMTSVRKFLAYLFTWRSGDYEIAAEWGVAAHHALARPFRALQLLAFSPLEPATAVALSGWQPTNMVVLRKLRSRTLGELEDAGEFYRAF